MLLEGQLFGFLVPESRYFSWLGPTMRMDRSCCWKGDCLAFWCGKVGILVGCRQLGDYRTLRVAGRAAFRLFGAGKSVFSLVHVVVLSCGRRLRTLIHDSVRGSADMHAG